MLNLDLTPEENIRIIYGNPYWKCPVDVPPMPISLYENTDVCYKELSGLITKYKDSGYKYRRLVGEKLRRLFPTLPSDEQREVGMALLGGRKDYSSWVCAVLDNKLYEVNGGHIKWFPCYAQAVEECWNRYHAQSCGDLLIKVLDGEIVKKYWDELCKRGHYLTLYKRFRSDPWFKLDTNELKRCMHVNNYFSLVNQTDITITEEEARLIMYQWVALVLKQESEWISSSLDVFKRYSVGERQIINISEFEVALYYLLCMKLDNVVDEILRWNELVKNQTAVNDEGVFRNVAIENFPEDLKFLLNDDKENDGWVEYQGRLYAMPKEFSWCIGKEGLPNLYIRTCDFELFENVEETEEDKDEAFYRNPDLQNLMYSLDLEFVIPE